MTIKRMSIILQEIDQHLAQLAEDDKKKDDKELAEDEDDKKKDDKELAEDDAEEKLSKKEDLAKKDDKVFSEMFSKAFSEAAKDMDSRLCQLEEGMSKIVSYMEKSRK